MLANPYLHTAPTPFLANNFDIFRWVCLNKTYLLHLMFNVATEAATSQEETSRIRLHTGSHGHDRKSVQFSKQNTLCRSFSFTTVNSQRRSMTYGLSHVTTVFFSPEPGSRTKDGRGE